MSRTFQGNKTSCQGQHYALLENMSRKTTTARTLRKITNNNSKNTHRNTTRALINSHQSIKACNLETKKNYVYKSNSPVASITQPPSVQKASFEISERLTLLNPSFLRHHAWYRLLEQRLLEQALLEQRFKGCMAAQA